MAISCATIAIMRTVKRESSCPVSKACGACTSVDVPYAEQLAAKQLHVQDLFADVSPSATVLPIIGMEDPFHYRNKVISPYAPGRLISGHARGGGRAEGDGVRDGLRGRGDASSRGRSAAFRKGGVASRQILTGMYAKGTHRLIPTDECLLENRIAKRVTLAVRDVMMRYGIEPYDEDAGTGFMRHAVVRVGHNREEVLVTLVTNAEEFPSSKSFCRELVKRVPQITTVVQSINMRQTNVILGDRERTLYGPGFILDTLCGLSFRISSHSFYQVNAVQTEVLYRQATAMAGLDGAQVVIDAYCGTGTIGLVAAKNGAARVIGVDNVKAAIADARLNARHNGVENAEFVAADAGVFMRERAHRCVGSSAVGVETAAEAHAGSEAAQVEEIVLFMDPPRAGASEEFLEAASLLSPSRIVYISCNPETQVRDIAYLQKRGYTVQTVQPVDMFPHTDHVETIALLSHTALIRR